MKRNDDPITIKVKRSDGRLILQALSDRLIMSSADKAEGRKTEDEHKLLWDAIGNIETAVTKAVNS